MTGHSGKDIYTRYVPGRISEADEALHPEMVYNLDVPAGVGFDLEMLRWFADITPFDLAPLVPAKPMLPKSLQFLELCKWQQRQVLRIKRRAPIVHEHTSTLSWQAPPRLNGRPNCLVIHYERTHHASDRKASEEYLGGIFKMITRDAERCPNVFVILGDRMPAIELGELNNPRIAGMPSSVWKLLRDRADQVAVICPATALRRAGAAISRRLSWEQTIEDAVAELRQGELLRAVSGVAHLVVVFGMVAALHCELRKRGDPSAQFVFAPNTRDLTFRDKFEDGETIGQTTSVVGFMLRELSRSLQDKQPLDRDAIARALRDSLTLNMRWFDCGFPSLDDYHGESGGEQFLKDYFDGKGKGEPKPEDIVRQGYVEREQEGKIPSDRVLGSVELNIRKIRNATKTQTLHRWQILRDEVSHKGLSRINLGIAICRFGHRNVLNRNLDANYGSSDSRRLEQLEDIKKVLRVPECPPLDNEISDDQPLPEGARLSVPDSSMSYDVKEPNVAPLYVPVIEFGNLVAVERQEMESFRSIRNLMKTYVEARPNTTIARRPISIAVFGAPGSGKSFAVKQIAASINNTATNASTRLEEIECNVAQFRTVEDLGYAITRIASINNQQRIPLVFFDEFDCSFDGKQFGWLKYFLAPMQDGTFYGASQTISFGQAIFVFAGGVSETLYAFDPYAAPAVVDGDAAKLEARKTLFKQQKGPDFVSRLRGHIDILSVNPDKTAVKDERGEPVKPVLRRAFTIRGQIMALRLYADCDGFQVANIDEDVLYALLTVDRYRHGTRSIEAILQMCAPMEDGMIEKASLPSRAQLSMHVDPEEFMIRVLRGRFRRFLRIEQGETSRFPRRTDEAQRSNSGPKRPGSSRVKRAITRLDKKDAGST
jgi:hypothetical protein